MKSNVPAGWLHWFNTEIVLLSSEAHVGSEFMVTEIPGAVSGCHKEGERWLDSLTQDVLGVWMNLKYDQVWVEEWSESQKQLPQLAKCLNYILHRTNAESSSAGELLKLHLDKTCWSSFTNNERHWKGKRNCLRRWLHLVRRFWIPSPYPVSSLSQKVWFVNVFHHLGKESWGKSLNL